MELLNSWIDRIPVDGDPSEITKAEILATGRCNLSGYFSKQCFTLHGRALKILFVHDWPDKTPGPPGFVFSIQAGLEWSFALLDPLTKYAYLNRVNQAYPKKAPLHKIRESLLRDQKSGFQVFRRFQSDILNFWREHAKPLNPGRDWRENERIAMQAFFALTQTKPEGLIGKLALGFMAEKLSTFCGNSQLSGQKLDVFSRFLQEVCKILQNEYAEAVYKLGYHAEQSKHRDGYEAHPEFNEAIRILVASRKGKRKSVFNFLKRQHRRDNPLEVKVSSGMTVYLFYECDTDEDGYVHDDFACYSLKHPKKPCHVERLTERTFRNYTEPRFQKNNPAFLNPPLL